MKKKNKYNIAEKFLINFCVRVNDDCDRPSPNKADRQYECIPMYKGPAI